MAFNFSKGAQIIGDLSGSDDAQRNTGIDFEDDQIDLVTGGLARLRVNNSGISSLNNAAFTGSLHGTASVALKDQIGETIVGGAFEIDQGIFQNPHASYNPIYFPSDDSFTERVGPSSINFFMAPFDGELIQIQLRSTGSFIGKALTASLHVGVDGDNAYSSTPASSLALNGQAINTTYTFDFSSAANTTFSAGNIYGFSLEIGGGFVGNETFRFTTVVKYNPYA